MQAYELTEKRPHSHLVAACNVYSTKSFRSKCYVRVCEATFEPSLPMLALYTLVFHEKWDHIVKPEIEATYTP